MSEAYLQNQFGLIGKKAIVTGGATGIGASIARALAAAGAEVCIHYFSSRAKAEPMVTELNGSGGRTFCEQADLRDPVATKNLFAKLQERWGFLDIAVLNAGDMIERRKICDLTEEFIDNLLRTNIHSALYSVRESIPLLQKSLYPSIILLSSVAAHHGGGNGSVLYAAAKGAIHTAVRGLSKELAPQIRVNGLSPGFILTDFHRKYTTVENQQKTIDTTALRRAGTAEDLAGAAVFLSSKAASFITGEIIEVNGGLWFA